MDPIQRTIRSYDEIAEEYCEKTLKNGDRELQKSMLDKTISYLQEGARIIDLGCGDGRDTDHLKRKGFDVVGIDLSRSMINLARKKYPDCTFIQMDMRDTIFPEDTFHFAWANAAIINLPKSEFSQLESEIYRILDKDGIFAFSFKKGEGEGMEDGGVLTDEPHPRYFSYYTLEEIEEELNLFDIIDSEESGSEIFGSKFIYCWARPKGKK